MSKQFPKLAVGAYEPTPEFASIAAHAAVMFERGCGLVATTGRAHDPEAQWYARLFAAAPLMAEALEKSLAGWADVAFSCRSIAADLPAGSAEQEVWLNREDRCIAFRDMARRALAAARGDATDDA